MIEDILVLLTLSFVAVALARRAGLSPILGFIVAGALVGPEGLALVRDSHAIRQIGEIGIVFLMFTIGLEFSLSRLVEERFAVVVLGGLQVLLTATAFALAAAWLWPLSVMAAVTVGVALAMSSTAIVSRLLIEGAEVGSRHGRTMICILLFQDLATIVFLMIMPVLATAAGADAWTALGIALAKGVGVFFVLLFVGRLFVRRGFHRVARLQSPEVFMLAVLVVSIGAAYFAQAAGLSLALGGFMAGMVIGETEFRHQVEADIRPFQDVLLGLFFVTIGMLVDLDQLRRIWPAALAATAALILVKGSLVFVVARASGMVTALAARGALTLAHGGEFGLMLVFLGLQLELLDAPTGQLTLVAILLSMLIAPFVIRHSTALAQRLSGLRLAQSQRGLVSGIESAAHDLGGHVILCGYGRVGRQVAAYLDREGVEYIALDTDVHQLQDSTDRLHPVRFGDARQRVVLLAAGLERAQAVVVTFDDVRATLKTLSHVHALRADITAIARAADEHDIDALLDAGATEVIPDTLEISLTLATHVLTLLGVPLAKVTEHNERIRADRYRLLRGVFRRDREPDDGTRVRVLTLRAGDHAVGRRLGDMPAARLGVKVSAIRRHGIRGAAPDPAMRLASEDALVTRGRPDALDRFAAFLTRGSAG
jgi:CPA2 family monovalent cation:H+ antiporter-2